MNDSKSISSYSLINTKANLIKCGSYCSKDEKCVISMIKSSICYLFDNQIHNLEIVSHSSDSILMLKNLNGLEINFLYEFLFKLEL